MWGWRLGGHGLWDPQGNGNWGRKTEVSVLLQYQGGDWGLDWNEGRSGESSIITPHPGWCIPSECLLGLEPGVNVMNWGEGRLGKRTFMLPWGWGLRRK